MELIGEKVFNKKYGHGVIIEIDSDSRITVDFDNSERKKFKFPDAFPSFLIAESKTFGEYVNDRLRDQSNSNSQDLSEFQKQERQQSNSPQSQKNVGKCNGLFFVLESAICKEKEFAEGRYLWCPEEAEGGFVPHHYKRIQSLQEGNIVFHYSDGYVTGISVVKEKCYACEKPYVILYSDDYWGDMGWRVDVEFAKFPKPIRLEKYREELVKYSTTKYSPFNKEGKLNIGYLFELPIDAAKYLIEIEMGLYPRLNDRLFMAQITSKIMEI